MVGIGRVAVLHFQEKLHQALLIQAQCLDEAVPLYQAECQA